MAISLAEWRTIRNDLVAGDPPVHYGGALVCPCSLEGHLLWHRWMVICLVGYNRLRGTFHLSARECCQAAPGWQTGHPSFPHAELSEHVIDITLKLERNWVAFEGASGKFGIEEDVGGTFGNWEDVVGEAGGAPCCQYQRPPLRFRSLGPAS